MHTYTHWTIFLPSADNFNNGLADHDTSVLRGTEYFHNRWHGFHGKSINRKIVEVMPGRTRNIHAPPTEERHEHRRQTSQDVVVTGEISICLKGRVNVYELEGDGIEILKPFFCSFLFEKAEWEICFETHWINQIRSALQNSFSLFYKTVSEIDGFKRWSLSFLRFSPP